MDSLPTSDDPIRQPETTEVEPTSVVRRPQSQDLTIEAKEENSDIKERETNQPTITSIFIKTLKKTPVQIEPTIRKLRKRRRWLR